MRTTAISAFALTLSSCTSFSGLQSSDVDRVVQSGKPVGEFVSCVSRSVGKAAISDESGNPVIAVTNAYGSPLAMFTFKPSGAGSMAEVRQHTGLAQTGLVDDCA